MSEVTRFGALPTIDNEVAIKAYVDSRPIGLTFARIIKTVDETINNNDTLQDDNELFVALLANTNYSFLLYLISISSAVADIKTAFSLPAGATGEILTNVMRAGGSVPMADITTEDSHTSDGTNSLNSFFGKVNMGGTAGNMQLQWAQNTAEVSNTSVLQGSLLLVWEEQ